MRTNDHFTLRIKATCIHLHIWSHTIRITSSQRLMVHGNIWWNSIVNQGNQNELLTFQMLIFLNFLSVRLIWKIQAIQIRSQSNLNISQCFCSANGNVIGWVIWCCSCSKQLGFMNHTQMCVISLRVFHVKMQQTRTLHCWFQYQICDECHCVN